MFFGATSIAQVPIGDDASVTRILVTGVAATGTLGTISLVTDNNLNAFFSFWHFGNWGCMECLVYRSNKLGDNSCKLRCFRRKISNSHRLYRVCWDYCSIWQSYDRRNDSFRHSSNNDSLSNLGAKKIISND